MFNLLQKLSENILTNLFYLKQDFIGINFNLPGIFFIFINFLFTIFLFSVFYLIGEKLQGFFLKRTEEKNIFVSFALGYILFGSIIAILGLFSLLYLPILYSFYLIVFLFALFPLKTLVTRISILKDFSSTFSKLFKTNKFIILATLFFVFIALIKLIIPDTGEDAIGYHTTQPQMYLEKHTTMLESKEITQTMYYPQLNEMLYLTTYSLGIKDSARYLHFGFYLIILLLLLSLLKEKKDSMLIFVPLIFATSSVIIRVTSSANADFPWVFTMLLASFIIFSKKADYKNLSQAGILFGGALASKLWVLAYLPLLLFYLFIKNKKLNKKYILKLLLIFSIISLAIPFLWYARSFIWTGNPIYPILAKMKAAETVSYPPLSNFLKINIDLFSFKNLVVYSPIFFLGILCFLLKPFATIKEVKNHPFFLFTILLFLEHLFLPLWAPRYNLILLIFLSFIASAALFINYKNIFIKTILVSIFTILFLYYFTNTLFTLPYGFGWADQNKYLTRVLARDNSSYYDFNHLFSQYISKNDLVATYRTYGFYYANFKYLESEYVFDKTNSFDNFKRKGVTKFFINGGDMEWFCRKKKVEGCETSKYQLLSKYTAAEFPRYLYSIR